MKKTEKMLLGLVAAAGLVYFGDRYGLIDAFASLLSLDNAELKALLEQNAKFRASLANVAEINRQFTDIESIFQTGKPGEPQKFGFTDQVVEICKKVDQERPKIAPPAYEEIPDVTEYRFVTLTVDLPKMTEKELTDFLRLLDENSIIVMSVEATNSLDRDAIRVLCKLAKIEKVRAAPRPEVTS